MDDAAAIGLLKQGDISGLEALVLRYQVQAVGAAFLICHDRALAEDIVQAAFVRVYERIDQFDATRAFAPWFMRSVVNDVLKAVTRRQRQLSLDLDSARTADLLPSADPDPATALEQAETNAAIVAALNRLTPQQRAAIVLRYYLGLSEAAMSAQLACPPSTVKWRLHAARRRLRQILPEWLRPAGFRSDDLDNLPPTVADQRATGDEG